MNILHIANSYGGTEVYTRLFSELDASGCRQTVFVPLNSSNHDRVGKRPIPFSVEGSALHYSTRLKRWHRYFYGMKIRAIVGAVEKEIDVSQVDLIHAHMLCVDGSVAYELSRRHAKPFVTAVRNTDLNTYFKSLPWKRGYFFKVFDSAARVIFLGPKYRRKLAAYCPDEKRREKIFSGSSIIPSGIAPVFLQQRNVHKPSVHVPARLVFVGAFYPGKGLKETIEAGDLLRDRGVEIELTAIGKGLPQRPYDKAYIDEVENMAKQRPWVKLKDFMPHEKLVGELREHDLFVMPSAPESFGLVYVEALSQGLPIIYTRGEGFDGCYEEGEVGWAVDPRNPAEIASQIEKVLGGYGGFADRIGHLNLDRDFSWSRIAEKYMELYNGILGSKK
jgi:glycosyltransferase involved in cell wall biosynthesis